jgi:uncharacterized protein (DUF2141 family)
MKRVLPILLGRYVILLVTFNCLAGQQDTTGSALRGDLYVLLTGFKSDAGKARVAVCNSEQNFDSNTSAFRGDSVKVQSGQAEILFSNIPFGEYAIKSYHDQNGDRVLNKGFMGMPLESYGFSNNARGTFGPPKWSAAKFKFETSMDTVKIELK